MANCKLYGRSVTSGVVMHADCLERQMKEMAKILHGQQKNDPLTWDELREMDGEPVWIVGVSGINHFRGNWDICDWENGEVVSFPYCVESRDISNYGITWLAYRRKPEKRGPDGWHCVRTLPWRDTPEKAQADLDQLAAKKDWKEWQEEKS